MRAGPKPSVDDSDCLFGHRAPVPAGSRRPARSSSGCRRKPALSAAVTGLPHLPGVRRFRFSADLGLVLRRTRRRCGQRGLGGIGGLADGPGEERAAVRDTPQSARDWLEETGCFGMGIHPTRCGATLSEMGCRQLRHGSPRHAVWRPYEGTVPSSVGTCQ